MHTELADVEDRYPRAAAVGRVARVIDYLFGLLYAVLAVRLVLELINARRGTGFYDLIASLSDPFYAPFRGILPTHNIDGARLVWPLVVAILGYMLLHGGIRGLLRLIARG